MNTVAAVVEQGSVSGSSRCSSCCSRCQSEDENSGDEVEPEKQERAEDKTNDEVDVVVEEREGGGHLQDEREADDRQKERTSNDVPQPPPQQRREERHRPRSPRRQRSRSRHRQPERSAYRSRYRPVHGHRSEHQLSSLPPPPRPARIHPYGAAVVDYAEYAENCGADLASYSRWLFAELSAAAQGDCGVATAAAVKLSIALQVQAAEDTDDREIEVLAGHGAMDRDAWSDVLPRRCHPGRFPNKTSVGAAIRGARMRLRTDAHHVANAPQGPTTSGSVEWTWGPAPHCIVAAL